jgi:hypothetical protein
VRRIALVGASSGAISDRTNVRADGRGERKGELAMNYPLNERRGEGWLTFAAIVLITAGIMRIFDALWAFDKEDEIGEELQVLLFEDDLMSYGWVWLIVGVLMILAGLSLFSGSELARWFGILMGVVGAVSSMLWIYQFPVWSLVGVMVSMLVIYGLAAYGGRQAREVG